MDLAKDVSCAQTYHWDESLWSLGAATASRRDPKFKVVAIDYGAKRNILRCLAAAGCDVTVVPANATTDDVLRHQPDGVFLANGPGDPGGDRRICRAGDQGSAGQATCRSSASASATRCWRLRLGRQDRKNAPRPPRRQSSGQGPDHGKVEITSQNHGFCVVRESLPAA
jgi:carbamoyl-phosphate synthase small subunit